LILSPALAWTAPGAEAESAPATPPPPTAQQARQAKLDAIVLRTLASYAAEFTDVDFVVIDSSGDVGRNMSLLARIIGKDPVPLDYEHPPELRSTLLYMTLMRVEFLLQEDIGSATLFRPGAGALAKRDSVCIVTLDPWTIAHSDRAATRHLLDLPEAADARIPPAHYLERETHLRFALEHEIYHCLDTRYNGPIARSDRKRWEEYSMLRDESGADAFALINQIARRGTVGQDARTLRRIRGLTLLAGDPEHYTYPTLKAVLALKPSRLARLDVHQRFRLATELRDRTVGSYAHYLRFARAANEAMRHLGVGIAHTLRNGHAARKNVVLRMVEETQRCYRALLGRTLPPPGHEAPSSESQSR